MPTLRLALVLVVAAGAALAAGTVGGRAVVAAAVAVGLVDALRCPRATDMQAGRHVQGPLHMGRPTTVTVALRWTPRRRTGARPLWWTDGAPSTLCVNAPAGRARLMPDRPFTASYTARPERRGPVQWGGPYFTLGSPWGLWCTRVDAALALERSVYPATAGAVAAAGAVESAGRPAAGENGLEFDGVRPYLPGEDAHRMDWRATARWDQPVIRRLRPERGRRLMLVIDAGRRSAQVPGDSPLAPTRLDRLCSAAMAAARTALAAGDAVGAAVLGPPWTVLSPRGGPAALHDLVELLARAQPAAGDADVARAVTGLLAVPCEAVFWFGEAPNADEAAPLLRYLPPLARRRAVAFLEVAPAFAEPVDGGERTRLLRAVVEESAGERRAVLHALARKGIPARDVPAEHVAAAAVTMYMRWAQRGATG